MVIEMMTKADVIVIMGMMGMFVIPKMPAITLIVGHMEAVIQVMAVVPAGMIIMGIIVKQLPLTV